MYEDPRYNFSPFQLDFLKEISSKETFNGWVRIRGYLQRERKIGPWTFAWKESDGKLHAQQVGKVKTFGKEVIREL